MLGLKRLQASLARAGLCTAEGMVTPAGRAAHAIERARRDTGGAGRPPLPRSSPLPDDRFLTAS